MRPYLVHLKRKFQLSVSLHDHKMTLTQISPGVIFVETPICVNGQGAPTNSFTIPMSTHGFCAFVEARPVHTSQCL